MSDDISFDDGLGGGNSTPSNNSGYTGMKRAPLGDYGQAPAEKKGMTQWLMEKLGIKSEMAMNVIQVVFALSIFALAGFIFFKALSM